MAFGLHDRVTSCFVIQQTYYYQNGEGEGGLVQRKIKTDSFEEMMNPSVYTQSYDKCKIFNF